jgi:hypothetical protein
VIFFGIWYNNDVNHAVYLEQPEYRNLASRATTALPFPVAAKKTFIYFNLS